jgi:hypothetical protein
MIAEPLPHLNQTAFADTEMQVEIEQLHNLRDRHPQAVMPMSRQG